MKNTILCELTTSNEKYTVESTLIIPIKNSSSRICGMLEVKFRIKTHIYMYVYMYL